MIISGNKSFSFPDQTNFFFVKKFNIESYPINSFFGLSNLKNITYEKIEFNVKKNRLYFKNKHIYSLNLGEDIYLSGVFKDKAFSCYINGTPIETKNLIYAAPANFYRPYNNYYINSDVNFNLSSLKIYGELPSYSLDIQNTFDLSSQQITGNFIDIDHKNIEIFSGSISNSSFNYSNIFKILDINKDQNNYNIQFAPLVNLENTYNNSEVYPIKLNLNTNFGLINKDFFITGTKTNSEFFKTFDVSTYQSNLSEIEIGASGLERYVISADLVSRNNTQEEPLDKILSVNLKYISGDTGNFSANIILSTGLREELSGNIYGSGYISKNVSVSGTGYNFLSNNTVTGIINDNLEEFVYLNQYLTNQDVNVQASGMENGAIVFKNLNTTINGYAQQGLIDYNNVVTGIIDGINVTGFITTVTGSGMASVFVEKIITGYSNQSITYNKNFFDAFNLATGTNSTNFVDFKNKSYLNFNNNTYSHSIQLDKNVKNVYIDVYYKKYFDLNKINVKLIVSGSNLSNTLSSYEQKSIEV
jgi:hypothetical protein